MRRPLAAPRARSSSRLLLALALGCALGSTRARAEAPVEISWDQDLAKDFDRENYQRLLTDIVRTSHSFVSAEIGLPMRSLRIQVYSRARYEKVFGTGAAWTRGAHYQAGSIHVNGGSRLDDGFAGGMVHEMTHAAVDYRGTARRLPTWLNEGLAERMAYQRRGMDALAPNQIMEVQYARRQGRLTPLPTWGHVTMDYLQFYAAALFLEKKAGKEKLLAIVRRTTEGESFERALDQELRWTVADLEREFVAWVDHLQ